MKRRAPHCFWLAALTLAASAVVYNLFFAEDGKTLSEVADGYMERWPWLGPIIVTVARHVANQIDPTAGTSPGGGGAGGGPLGLGLIPPGPGGRPGGWVRFRKNAVPDESTGADTTAPSAPTPHFVSATNSSITVNATGSVDS